MQITLSWSTLMSDRYTITLEEDPETGDVILPLPDELLEEAGWKEGDTIKFTDNKNGTFSMTKLETELVLVDCVSTFRIRYVVEVPIGKKEWALDTVVMNDAEEISQEHLGEQIVSHRVITDEEYLRVFNEDNDYLNSWNDEDKRKYIKRWEEESTSEVEHSKYYYDTERNK